MKELSIEQKAKRYNEALKRAMRLYEQGTITESLSYIFPELKESEDERIRRDIIRYLKKTSPAIGENIEKMLAWLEKQGESIGNDMKETLRTEYEKGRADAIAEMQKPVDCIDCTNSKGCINCKDGNMKETLVRKPAWSEEDEVKINRIVACLENLNVADNDILLRDVEWLKSLKDRVQPKQEWSDEDESIALGIEQIVNCASLLNIAPDRLNKVRDWLKSLNERVQPKEELSEENARLLDNCISLIEDIPCTEDEQNWLKSLRPQNRWKPSDEQIKALHDLNLTGNISYAGQGQVLIELYNDLYTIWKEKEVFK